MPVSEMAQRLKTSTINIKRAFFGTGQAIYFYNGKHKQRPDIVKAVLSYYEKKGLIATQKRFPNVKVKSITNRPSYYGVKVKNRQIRWTDEQVIELARMAGIVSFEAQAKYFNRPRAYAGSIKSAWSKKFGYGGNNINGMAHWIAKYIVTEKCPMRPLPKNKAGFKIALWVDMEKHLQAWVPDEIKTSIRAMAKFQRWLHGPNVRHKISQLKLKDT